MALALMRHVKMKYLALRFGLTMVALASMAVSGLGPVAAQSPAFENVADTAGITGSGIGAAAGVSFFDFTGDGWDDVTFVLKIGVLRLLANNRDGTFSVFTPPNTFTDDGDGDLFAGGTWGAPIWFDANGDPWPDLFVGGTKTALFLGAADGSLFDVTAAAGLHVSQPIVAAAIADVDLNGANDLFLAVDDGPDKLFLLVAVQTPGAPDVGAGGGLPVPIYRNEAAARGVMDPPGSQPMQSVFVDADLDGDMDLYSLYDGQTRSRFFVNDGAGQFTEEGALLGLDDIGPGNSMGVAVSDLNGDQYPDFYVSRIGTGGLFVSAAASSSPAANPVTYTDVAAAWGASRNGMSWGTVFLDADLDGDEDLAVVHSSSFDGTPALFFERTGPETFSERGALAGFGFMAENQGLAVGDFDQDGRPDVIVPATTGPHRLLRNISGGSTPDGSSLGGRAPGALTVRLHGPPGNRTSIGARIELQSSEAPGNQPGNPPHQPQTRTRFILAGESFMSQSSNTVLFGSVGTGTSDTGNAGAESAAPVVRVTWPDGVVAERTLSSGDLAAGRVDMVHAFVTHVATRPTSPTAAGAAPQLAVWPNPAPAGVARPFRVDIEGGSYELNDITLYDITLFDITGRRISPEAALAPGVYLLRAHHRASQKTLTRLVSVR